MTTRPFALLALWAILCVPGLSAQGPRAALQQLGPDKLIRVSVDGNRLQGRTRTIEGDDLLLAMGERATRVPIAAIDTLWRRRGAYGRGALVGGAFGAAAFTGFLHFVVSIACESSEGCRDDRRRAWGYGLVLGGAGGALLGAGIGGLFNRWERLEPSQR